MPDNEEVDTSLSDRIGIGLFARVSDFFSLMFGKVWKEFAEIIEKLFDSVQERLRKLFYTQVDDSIREKTVSLIDGLNISQEIKDRIKTDMGQTSWADIGKGITSAVAVLFGGFFALGNEYTQPLIQTARKDMQVTIPDIVTVIQAIWKNPEYRDTVKDYFYRMGLDDRAQQVMMDGAKPILDIGTIRELLLRKEITEEKAIERLKQHGYDIGQVKDLQKLFYYLPGVQDLITMSVREVFTPEIARRFGQYEDYPPELTKYAGMIGLSEEWAKRYWAMHWRLPSTQMGFEMLHRGVIDQDDLNLLLRASDIMPFWRDKVTAISYKPYTRVDVRRMYNEGVIERDGVKRTYLDLGYDDEHAENLTEFTELNALEKERAATKADITNAYKRKLITQDETVNMLLEMGYTEQAVLLIIARVNYDNTKREKDDLIKITRKRFIKGIIDNNKAMQELAGVNLTGAEIDLELYQWGLEKEAAEPELTLKNLEEMVEHKVITLEGYSYELDQKGYSDRNNQLLTDLVDRKF